jgi:hypothetical protein
MHLVCVFGVIAAKCMQVTRPATGLEKACAADRVCKYSVPIRKRTRNVHC